VVTQPVDDVVTLVRSDHRQIEDRFHALAGATGETVGELLWKLIDALVRHEVAEEVAVYPALRLVSGGDAVAERHLAEQARAEVALAELERVGADDLEFANRLAALQESVLGHAAGEEADVLPMVAESVDPTRLIGIGERYQAAKASAPSHPHPHLPDDVSANVVLGPVVALVDRIREAASSI